MTLRLFEQQTIQVFSHNRLIMEKLGSSAEYEPPIRCFKNEQRTSVPTVVQVRYEFLKHLPEIQCIDYQTSAMLLRDLHLWWQTYLQDSRIREKVENWLKVYEVMTR